MADRIHPARLEAALQCYLQEFIEETLDCEAVLSVLFENDRSLYDPVKALHYGHDPDDTDAFAIIRANAAGRLIDDVRRAYVQRFEGRKRVIVSARGNCFRLVNITEITEEENVCD
jgi:hypothetical protein